MTTTRRLAPFLGLFLLAVSATASAQESDDARRIRFPNVDGFLTLKTDLHTHSVFSDGEVWPSIRVQEAIRDGLDAISLTEHLEYQPHQDDIPHPDRNRAYALAIESVGNSDLMIIPGSEVTRSNPPGHVNAIFIKDANRLLLDDPLAILQEANAQGAYVFWNHPNWLAQRPSGTAALTDFHRQLISEGLLHGIEVVNDLTYSDEALSIAIEQELAVIGTSDIHGLVDWQYRLAQGGHRPITLVLAQERSLEGIHEALKAGRTIAWFEDLLVGEARNLDLLLPAMLTVGESAQYAVYGGDLTSVLRVKLNNNSSARLILENVGPHRFHNSPRVFTLEPGEARTLELKTGSNLPSTELELKVLSALVAPETHPVLTLPLQIGG